MELTPADRAYLSLYKLVPVVVRKRSEKENEKARILTSRQAHQETLQCECLDLCAIPLVILSWLIEDKTCFKFRVTTGLTDLKFHYFVLTSETLGKPLCIFYRKIMVKSQEL